MSPIAVVVTPLEAGTPVVVIKFVAHKIALTRMESLICVLHIPELNELNEPSPMLSSFGLVRAEPSRASTRLGPELGNISSV
jgi:hypothetical protein